MNYFALATALTRAEAAPTLARVAQKQVALRLVKNGSREVCCCSAYLFPHRAGSGWCPGVGSNERNLEDINAEELALFDRAEARAINSGAW